MPTKTAEGLSMTLPCECGLRPKRLSGFGTAKVGAAPSSVPGLQAQGGRGLTPTFSLAGYVPAGNSDIQGGRCLLGPVHVAAGQVNPFGRSALLQADPVHSCPLLTCTRAPLRLKKREAHQQKASLFTDKKSMKAFQKPFKCPWHLIFVILSIF